MRAPALRAEDADRLRGVVGAAAADADEEVGVAVLGSPAVLLQFQEPRECANDVDPTTDVADVPEFGERLTAGETATVVLVTPTGETVARQVSVPSDLPADANEVGL